MENLLLTDYKTYETWCNELVQSNKIKENLQHVSESKDVVSIEILKKLALHGISYQY